MTKIKAPERGDIVAPVLDAARGVIWIEAATPDGRRRVVALRKAFRTYAAQLTRQRRAHAALVRQMQHDAALPDR